MSPFKNLDKCVALVAVSGVTALALTGCGSGAGAGGGSSGQRLTGTLYVHDDDVVENEPASASSDTGQTALRAQVEAGHGPPCQGYLSDAFSDIAAGTPVEVDDASGKVIAVATLDQGRLLLGFIGNPDPRNGCVFTFATTVPKTAFYQFKVGSRAGITLSEKDLASSGRNVALTIG